MAKKKKKSAAERQPSEPAAAQEQETSSCSGQELDAALFVNEAAEALLRLAQATNQLQAHVVYVTEFFRVAQARLQSSPASTGVSAEENGEGGWNYSRGQLVDMDRGKRPYLRVVGRVAHILLNNRGFRTISAGDVFTVFLVEISEQLEEHHRQRPPPGQELSVNTVDVSTGEGRRTFNNRMNQLCRKRLIAPTATTAHGKNKKFVLTNEGQCMFHGWPPPDEIPGLELDGPVKPESRPRRRSKRRT
jgi:hypothetical protein